MQGVEVEGKDSVKLPAQGLDT